MSKDLVKNSLDKYSKSQKQYNKKKSTLMKLKHKIKTPTFVSVFFLSYIF